MSEVKHTPWEVGQHPAVSNGWIVRPIMLGSNVRVLPECEGGHVLFKDEAVAHKVSAAEDMYSALKDAIGALEFSRDYHNDLGNEEQDFAQSKLDAALKALSKAEGRQ